MDDSERILTPQQLPTPADSPVFFRTDAAAFHLPQSPQTRDRPIEYGYQTPARRGTGASAAEFGSTSSLASSVASTSTSLWSTGDRFIPQRRAASQTSFDVLSPSSTLPRSHSAPLHVRTFSGYSAHRVASTQEYTSLLRSELLGPAFLVDAVTPQSERQQSPAQERAKPRRQSSSTATSLLPCPNSPRNSPPVLSFSGTTSPLSNSPQSFASDSPLGQAYRLSPFNATTERVLSSPPNLPRKICLTPCRVLDAPNLGDNFYESSLDWSTSNSLLAVALGAQVFTWSAAGQVTRAVDGGNPLSAPKVTSVRWIDTTDHLAVGKGNGEVAIYDARTSQLLRQLTPHRGRVGVLATLSQSVTSGSADQLIMHRDLRMKDEVVRVIKGYKAEVTALEWSSDRELASGGNDNSVRIFNGFEDRPFLKLRKAHSAAIKALAWSPHQRGLLATGGGTEDQTLRFWNTRTGALLKEIETGSQVCQVVWSKTTNEIVSTHGYSSKPEYDNCVHVWRYSNSPSYVPPYNPIASLASGRGRMLHCALSPDGRYIVCGSSDEVLRFWDVFPPAPSCQQDAFGPRATTLDVYSGIR
ncbi:hypothetical protein JCM11491_000154 [Sporobolomyces phaffii]